MRMFRKYLILAVMLCLLVPWVASADETMSDEATLGNRDSSDHYRWRVNSSGHLLPGTTGTYNIGGTSNYVNDINASGNLTFQTYLLATGMGSGNATSLPTTAANAQTPLYRVAKVFITTRTLTFANGYPGQILTLVAEPSSDTGTLTIDATTQYGWSSLTMDTVADTAVLLYVDDTIGWVIIASQGSTVVA